MIINDNTRKIELPEKSLRKSEIKELAPEIYPTISRNPELLKSSIYLNDTLCYVKIIGNTNLLHELIGVYLANSIGLDTVDYKIGVIGNLLYAISPIFFKPGHTYRTCKEYYNVTASQVLVHDEFGCLPKLKPISILNNADTPEMLDSILKLIALDLKMGQYDRHNLNVTLDTYQGTTTIAPIYDYSASYDEHTRRYANPFVIIKRNPLNIWYFTKLYPSIKPYFNTLRNTPLTSILEQIEKDFDVIITDKEKEDYYQKDKALSRLLTK